MFHVVLFEPEIPQNTGNIGRLCSVTNAALHLIHPLGFKITDKHLKRSGMDYWKTLELYEHANWEAFLAHEQCPERIWLLTTRGAKTMWEAQFEKGDGLLFGKESGGVPQYVHDWVGERRIKIPHMNEHTRSLNLSTAAGVVVYEALRHVMHPGLGN